MALKPKGKRPAAGTKQARQAARTRLLREIHELAIEAIKDVKHGRKDAAIEKLETISKRGNK